MGTNIGGRLEGFRTTDEPSSAVWFLPELFMASPEEEQKKAAEAKAREQAKPATPNEPAGDAFSFVGQLVGDAKNLAVDALAGQHSGDKVLAGISPELAAQYKQGKEVQEGIATGALKEGHLNATDQRNLDAFNSVRKTISQVPLYDRDSLMRYVEKGIEQKSRTVQHETAMLASQEPTKPARSEAVKPVSEAAKITRNELAKPTVNELAKTIRSEAVKPAASEAVKPAASEAAKPKQSDTAKLSQPESAKSASPEAVRPAQHDALTSTQLDAAKPAVSELAKLPRTEAATAAQPESLNSGQRENLNPAQRENLLSAQRDAAKPPLGDFAKPPSLSDIRGLQAGETKSPAFTTFERRTSSDARSQQERKPGVSEASASNSKDKSQTYFADSGAQKSDARSRTESSPYARLPFENMRRVLDERTASANNQSHSAIDKAHSVIERVTDKQQGRADSHDEHRTMNSASRTTLSEVKANLSPQQMQQLVRTSEERFPAGLRWQNTLQQSSTDARTRIPQSGGKVLPDVIRQPGEMLPPVNTQHSESPHSDGGARSFTGRANPGSPLTSEVSLPGAKTNLAAGKGDGQTVSARVGQYANTRDAQYPNTRDAQSSSSREQSLATSERGILTFQGRIQNRYITGAEIALAAIIAAAGAKRIRFDELPPPGSERAGQMPLVHSIEAFLPNSQTIEPRDVSTTGQTAELISKTSADQISEKQQNSFAEIGSKRSNSTEKSFDVDDVPGTARYLQKHQYKRRKMLIGPQDTFVSIAESLIELRNDSRYAWLIADINLPRIKETYVDGKRVVEVRSRQEIEIPGEFDVEAFDLHRKEEFSPENLITVVLESQIDRELLDEHFGVFVDGGKPAVSSSPPRDAFPSPSMSPSLLSQNTVAGDASVLLPSLAVNSANVLRVARQQLVEITRQAFESGRKPIFKLKNSLKRNRIKRNL